MGRGLVSWPSRGEISGRLLRNARTKLLLGPYCSRMLVFLPSFFFFFSPFRIDDFPVVRVFYRDLNGGMVSSSRICTVCLHTKELTDLRETALTIVFLTVAIWNFGAARNYTGV